MDAATSRADRDKVISVLVMFQSPSYAGRAAADLFLRMPSAPSDAKPLAEYGVRLVAADQDLYIAQSALTSPQAVLCRRKSKRPRDLSRQRCGVLDPIDLKEYPLKPDGRSPLVRSYRLDRTHLGEVADIDRRLRAPVDQDGIPQALAMQRKRSNPKVSAGD